MPRVTDTGLSFLPAEMLMMVEVYGEIVQERGLADWKTTYLAKLMMQLFAAGFTERSELREQAARLIALATEAGDKPL